MFGLGVLTIILNDIAPFNHLQEGLQEGLQPFLVGAFSSIDVSSKDSLSFYL
jgi:hypothetical protein